ncbi:MAG TPA: co-chaperone GroES [Candidatus Caccopulliclostridium gallistercoris]|uniref:Co-chaperonin GroES n=1 Tax=Candidatus Caccopulliclostridium gallistercoris TaxID=2840719 RepID=A0A9D1NEM9_9FIRM|nr:co-chaperone GroES [Candidatus Caccopulliclostridium gallistercoris]
MELRPLFDRIVIKPLKTESKTEGGIMLPAVAQEKSQLATVVSVGEGGLVDGKEVKMVVKPKDKILYSKYAGTEVKFEGEELIVIRQTDVLAVIE